MSEKYKQLEQLPSHALREERTSYFKKFNNKITQITRLAVNKSPNEPKFLSIKSKVHLVKQIAPNDIIEVAGPEIFKYKKQIKERDEDFFMYGEEFEAYLKKSVIDVFNIHEIFLRIRVVYPEATEEEKDTIWDILNKLVGYYIMYAMIQKILLSR